MKKSLIAILLAVSCLAANAQVGHGRELSLEECHALALASNKSLKIAREKVAETEATKKMAFCEMLPRLTANGTYNWNQKSVQLLSDDQQNAINSMGTTVNDRLTQSMTGLITQLSQTDPTVAMALMQTMQGMDIAGTLNGVGQSITSATNLDLANVFSGSVTVSQPVFMGGRLRELYKSARAAAAIAGIGYRKEQEDLLLKVDEAYWRVISLQRKQHLAQQYCDLLDTMYQNVLAMQEAEMATEADITKVRVRLNEAQMNLAKASSGLALSKMLLFQLCGLDLHGGYTLDEGLSLGRRQPASDIDMAEVLKNRSEMKILAKSEEMASSAVKIAAASLQPSLVAQGSYVATNPNLFNGFSNTLGGMFTAGAVLNIPICPPSAIYSVKAAKHQRNEVRYQIEEAGEKIQLQVSKLNYELEVANTKLQQSESNLSNAEENLKLAQDSFAAGVISSSDLLAAQTAWLSASSELLDSEIEVQMDYRYLQQALGK